MAEKYTLFLNAPNSHELADFLKNNQKYTFSFISENVSKYLDFPSHFDFYFRNTNFAEGCRLEKIKRKLKNNDIDFEAKILFPKEFQEMIVLAKEKSVKVNLTSKLLDNDLSAKISKKGKKFEFSLCR